MSAATVKFSSISSSDPASKAAPIVGDGTVEVRGDGLHIHGRRSRNGLAWFAAILVGLIGITGAAILLVALGVEPGQRGIKKIGFLAGMIAGVLPGVFVHGLVRSKLRGGALAVVVPFGALRVLESTPERTVLRLAAPELKGDVAISGGEAVLKSLPRQA